MTHWEWRELKTSQPFCNWETFVEFTPVSYIVNERERMVVLNISASGVGALSYSVRVDVLPGTAQGRCIVRADCVVMHF